VGGTFHGGVSPEMSEFFMGEPDLSALFEK